MGDWKKIEALLFASGKYLSEDKLVELSGLSKAKLKKALVELKKKYDGADTSLAVYNEGDSWKLNVKEEFTDVIRGVVSDAEMPRAVMETLAVIAYKSPVLQSEIKDIRGASVYDHIPLLESKGFISREKHGRSYKIKLTGKFHEYFDIDGDSKLSELFKDVKRPDKPEKLGELDVYESDDDKEFTDKILERMKKLEKTNSDDVEENNFLNSFEEKFERAKKSIDESEEDIASFRKKTDEDTEELFKDEDLNKASSKSAVSSSKGIFDDDSDSQSDEDDTDGDVSDSADAGGDDSGDEDESSKDDDVFKEPLVDEDGNPLPDFVDKINKQIDVLTEGRDDLKDVGSKIKKESVDESDDDSDEIKENGESSDEGDSDFFDDEKEDVSKDNGDGDDEDKDSSDDDEDTLRKK